MLARWLSWLTSGHRTGRRSRRRAAGNGAATAGTNVQPDPEPAPIQPRGTAIDHEAGVLAHELVQPLTAIAANAEAARHCLRRQPADILALQQIADDIYHETRRALEVAEWIRGELRGDTPSLVLVDLADSIDEALSAMSAQAARHDAQVDAHLHARPLHVLGSPGQIRQVLINLIINALEATELLPAGQRRIRVEGWRDGDSVFASVHDTGTGAAEDHLDRMFEPFVSAKPMGVGLGLSISRSIARRHGGDLVAKNNTGGGMTFSLILPATTVATAPTGSAPDRPSARSAPG
ncbi:sensor histidine kinase [Paracidovorax citrulli]